MPTLNVKLPQWLAGACGVLALAAWVLSFGHLLPVYSDWEQAALLFFGVLSSGIFAAAPSVSNRINVKAVAELPAAVTLVKAAVQEIAVTLPATPSAIQKDTPPS